MTYGMQEENEFEQLLAQCEGEEWSYYTPPESEDERAIVKVSAESPVADQDSENESARILLRIMDSIKTRELELGKTENPEKRAEIESSLSYLKALEKDRRARWQREVDRAFDAAIKYLLLLK
jgi:hypothetical protein